MTITPDKSVSLTTTEIDFSLKRRYPGGVITIFHAYEVSMLHQHTGFVMFKKNAPL